MDPEIKWPGGQLLFKKGTNYKIVTINNKFRNAFIYDEYGTKRPISIDKNDYNFIRVYWEDYFICREIKIAELLDDER